MRRSVVLAVLVAFAAITVARTALKWDAGLRSEYVTNPATGQTGRTGVDRDASTDVITRAWNGVPPETFRVRWLHWRCCPYRSWGYANCFWILTPMSSDLIESRLP